MEILLKQGTTKIEIARLIGISRSTLYRELERGTVETLTSQLKKASNYYHDTSQLIYENNRKNCRKPYKLSEVSEFISFVEEQILVKKLSPDAIYGRACLLKSFDSMICTKTIYNYIDLGLLKVKNIDLPLRVKLKTKSRRCRTNRRILDDSIENRPRIVDERSEFGHYILERNPDCVAGFYEVKVLREIDTVVGTCENSPVLLTLDERVTRMRLVVKIPSKTSSAVEEGINSIFSYYGDKADKIFKTITSDNGSEFSTLHNTTKIVKYILLILIHLLNVGQLKNKTQFYAVSSLIEED
ncbi:MAG: IS30 family transposase [Lachnospirales bacterium]